MSWMSGRHRNVIQVMVGLLLAGELALASAIAGSPAAMPRGPLTIAVVGDQNTAGVKNRVVWPTLMAGRTGWSVSNFAQPEAGFAADGTGGQAFTYQVDRAQANRVSIARTPLGRTRRPAAPTHARGECCERPPREAIPRPHPAGRQGG